MQREDGRKSKQIDEMGEITHLSSFREALNNQELKAREQLGRASYTFTGRGQRKVHISWHEGFQTGILVCLRLLDVYEQHILSTLPTDGNTNQKKEEGEKHHGNIKE